MADISLLPTAYSSTAKIASWKKWHNHQERRLHHLINIQKGRSVQYADILSFKGLLKSLINPSLWVQRQHIVWEMRCIKTDVNELQKLVRSHPEITIDKWRDTSLG